MPISMDPGERRLFSLKSDAEKPEATRPMFECIVPTRRQVRQQREAYDKVQSLDAEARRLLDANDVEAYDTAKAAAYAEIEKMALAGVRGWRNFGRPFKEDAPLESLNDVLNDAELVELAYGWTSAVRLSEDDRKNS